MTPNELLDKLAAAQAENRVALAETNTELAAVEAAFEENEKLTKALGDGCPYAGLGDE